jgi:hypothetical protein
VLEGLKGSTKAMFLPGRFLPSTERAAVLALGNQPTVDHCEKKRTEVEAVLAAHFGRPISLTLVVDRDPPAGGSGPGPAPVRAEAVAEEEPVDVRELEDAPPQGSGLDRLTEAFPGAELVDEP